MTVHRSVDRMQAWARHSAGVGASLPAAELTARLAVIKQLRAGGTWSRQWRVIYFVL